MTQAVASKSIASAERIKNQLFMGPFLSVFFTNNLIFNKLLGENCSNNIKKITTFIATFTSSRTATFIATFWKTSRNIRHFRPQQSHKRPTKSCRDCGKQSGYVFKLFILLLEGLSRRTRLLYFERLLESPCFFLNNKLPLVTRIIASLLD